MVDVNMSRCWKCVYSFTNEIGVILMHGLCSMFTCVTFSLQCTLATCSVKSGVSSCLHVCLLARLISTRKKSWQEISGGSHMRCLATSMDKIQHFSPSFLLHQSSVRYLKFPGTQAFYESSNLDCKSNLQILWRNSIYGNGSDPWFQIKQHRWSAW